MKVATRAALIPPSVLFARKAVPASLAPQTRLENSRFQLAQLQDVAAGRTKISRGSKGDGVRQVQQALRDMGFYVGSSVDGSFGPRTRVALMNFQDSQKLPRTGVLDQATMTRLNRVAPPAGQTLVQAARTSWGEDQNLIPSNLLADGKRARAVIDLSEKRLFFYDERNQVSRVMSVATGNAQHADGRGVDTSVGLRVVMGKNDNPGAIGQQLWGDAKAFGTRLLDLSIVSPVVGRPIKSGQELHGTYNPNSLGTKASHGCMRVSNEDIEYLYKQMRKGDLIDVRE